MPPHTNPHIPVGSSLLCTGPGPLPSFFLWSYPPAQFLSSNIQLPLRLYRADQGAVHQHHPSSATPTCTRRSSLAADPSALPPPLPPHRFDPRLRRHARRPPSRLAAASTLCTRPVRSPRRRRFRIRATTPVPASPADAPPPASAPPCPSPPVPAALDSARVPSRCRSARVLAASTCPLPNVLALCPAHARPAPCTPHTRTHLATAPCSACLSRPALSAHPFRPTSTPLPSSPPMPSHALLPVSCPPPPLLASAHPPSCRRTLVLSTDGDGMNRTAVRDHRIDLQALDRIIALGDASRTNAAALEAQRRPNPALQPVRGAAPAPGNLLERAARPLHRVQVNTHELLRAALPPADPPALATVPRGGRVLVHYGLGSVRSSAFLGVFVIIYERMPMLPARVILYLTPTIVYVVVWAVEVLASVGRASGVRDERQIKDTLLYFQPAITLTWHPYRPSFITPTPRTALWFGRSKVSFESGGWAEAVDRVLAKQPAHRPRGTLLNGRPITYFARSELSSALEGHAEAAGLEEAKRAPGVKQAVEAFFGAKIGTKCLLDGSKVSCVASSYSTHQPTPRLQAVKDHFKRQFSRRKLLQEVPPLYQAAYLNNLIRVKNNLSTHDTRNKVPQI
ncbi:hypothetical protein B0H14DRAFT_2599012 [Mycena olivaceomarginata]|nr:hypothetical protein B0H14DRAFT_2599012 [Mycena olivaceomarginata]